MSSGRKVRFQAYFIRNAKEEVPRLNLLPCVQSFAPSTSPTILRELQSLRQAFLATQTVQLIDCKVDLLRSFSIRASPSSASGATSKRRLSLDNLLLESFRKDTFYFQKLEKDNEILELRVRGQNSQRVDRDAMLQDSPRGK